MKVIGLGFCVDFEPRSPVDWVRYLKVLNTEGASRRFYHALRLSRMIRESLNAIRATT
jgi:hypothetical protein